MIDWPITETDSKVTVHTICPFCGSQKDITVASYPYYRWKNGAHPQSMFPSMNADDRERLISGTCEGCFPPDEEE